MAMSKSDMPPIRVPSNLPELVKSAFNRARASGDLTYYPTEVTILHINSIPFQLRFSPSLANKPRAPEPHPRTAAPFDPFADPPAALLVSAVPPAHNLVLNKFAVVPGHFILATAAFLPQDHLLDAGDLAAAYACIEAYRRGEEEGGGGGGDRDRDLFVFFNSGPHSGASQPHRHLQLLPVEGMRDGLAGEGEGAWEVLAERLLAAGDGLGGGEGGGGVAARLPFRTFAGRIGRDMGPREMREVYLRLYREACRAAGRGGDADGVGVEVEVDGEARISYNLAMTRHAMVLCPRVAEGSTVSGPGGATAGKLSLNGTVLAGTALVKTQAEWDALRGDPAQLRGVLEKIGVPTNAG